MEETIAALQTLYLGTNSLQKQQANQWLQDFVNRSEAWTICDQLLRNPNMTNEVYYFAAQTLHTKVVSALEDLPLEARFSLRQSLLEHLDRFKAAAQIITVQLGLSLAALAIQTEAWENPVQDVTQLFGSNPATLSLLLDFLTVLPDECENPRIPITKNRRKAISAMLLATAPTIVGGLLQYSRANPGNIAIQNRVFACLLGWIKMEVIPLETLASSEFVPLLFESLIAEPLFDTSVDLLCEVISQSRNLKNMKLVNDLMTRLPQLIVAFRSAVASDNSDVARGLARLFIAAGEAYLFEVIAKFETYGILTELILECTAHKDLDIAQISFNFWFQLAEELPSVDYREFLPKFYSAFSRLMGIIINHLTYPDDSQTWTAEQKDDFRDFRHVVGDTLKDCCAVLGGEKALELVYDHLVTQVSNPATQWQTIEAALFSVRSMASGVTMTDSAILPKVMDLILSNRLPNHPKIRYTVTLIIGRYATWSRENPVVLQPQIEYIVRGFSEDEVCAASALALKHLTKACDNLLAGSLQSLLEFHMTTAHKMKIEDLLEITEAIANLVSALPPEKLGASLSTFWYPLAAGLNQLSLAPIDTQSVVLPQLFLLLDRLTIFIKYLDPHIGDLQHPLISILTESWAWIERIFDKYGTIPEVAEKMCRWLKYSVKSCKLHFRGLLEPLVTRLVFEYRRSTQSAYLYASKEIVYQFGTIPGTRALLLTLLSEMSTVTFSLLQRHENFVQHPDIVEDYFMFFKEYLESCPNDIIPYLDPVFQCGLGGLTFNHREAIEAVISFFDRLFVVARRRDNEAHVFPVVTSLVDRFGYHLVHALLQGMTGIFPSRCFDSIAEILRELLEISPERTQHWIETSLGSLPARVSVAEKQQFLHDVYHTYKGPGFTKMLKAFGSVLKQRK